jgi:16S rRNA (adenine(1408)-N(1))-methyltransferase
VEVPTDNSIDTPLKNLSPLTGEGVIIDIGTGDGRFVYQSARQNPNKFYIGIDPNVRPLEKISEKIHRKPSKGGAPNVLFVQAAVEDLPPELDGVADEVHVHFPWGGLLRAFAAGEVDVLRNVRRICSPGAMLEVVLGLDTSRDRSEIERLNIPELTTDYVATQLLTRYRSAGFDVFEHGSVSATEWSKFETSWARRLQNNEHRSVVYLIARAV